MRWMMDLEGAKKEIWLFLVAEAGRDTYMVVWCGGRFHGFQGREMIMRQIIGSHAIFHFLFH